MEKVGRYAEIWPPLPSGVNRRNKFRSEVARPRPGVRPGAIKQGNASAVTSKNDFDISIGGELSWKIRWATDRIIRIFERPEFGQNNYVRIQEI